MTEDFLFELSRSLRKGWTAHLSSEGRIYYMNHETKISSWLPPVESWDSGGTGLPYGWEAALDHEGRTYYINHTSRTTTYVCPRRESGAEDPPQPREVTLIRDPQAGFGFVAGSEKPVIVRFVTEGGLNEQKLMPGDQILRINGEDVSRSPREHVIELIRSCKQTVHMLVCQPQSNNTSRKSALLTAAKKAKLRNNPSKVRFSEGVIVNGSPLYSPSPVDAPFMPNVLKVFLENGQTKSFKYDCNTTVKDVLNSLLEKLSIRSRRHFSLATDHIKITRRNRLALLDPEQTIAKIAARPGSHHLRCVLRVAFVPRDAYDLLQEDPVAFDYLYMQCCNDIVDERYIPELKYEISLRLSALAMHHHALTSGMQGKITLKAIERECGLERFVASSLLDTMRLKELRKALSVGLKQSSVHTTPLKAKIHYLRILGEQPAYGAKCLPTNLQDSSPEMTLLINPRYGISQISCLRNTNPVTLVRIEDLITVRGRREDEFTCYLELHLRDRGHQTLTFGLEERDAEELVILLRGYHLLLTAKELTVLWDSSPTWHQKDSSDNVPPFHSRHVVRDAPWSYPPSSSHSGLRSFDLSIPTPPFMPCELPTKSRSQSASSTLMAPLDFNMNETPSPPPRRRTASAPLPHRCVDERHPGIDYQTVISMELLEDNAGDIDVDIYEAKNDEVIRRVAEMNQILQNAQSYLSTKDEDQSDLKRILKLSEKVHNEGKNNSTSKKNDDFTDLDRILKNMVNGHEAPHLPNGEAVQVEEDDDEDTDSPLNRGAPFRNSLANTIRRDSSFGLHSPDVLSHGEETILDLLRHLKSEEALCLDPDLIDLTMIPPPTTPECDNSPAATVNGEVIEAVYETPLKEPSMNGHIHVEMSSAVQQRSSIDSLIASLTVPPPPFNGGAPVDLTYLIVPPPPPRSGNSVDYNSLIVPPPRLSDIIDFNKTLEDDSSGYDTLNSSLTDSDNGVRFFEEPPPVSPGVRTSCVDDVPSTSSLSTTSSESIPSTTNNLLAPPIPAPRRKASSCEDLLVTSPGENMVRSASWSDLNHQSSFRRNYLRRSFHRSANRGLQRTLTLRDNNGRNGIHQSNGAMEQAQRDIWALVCGLGEAGSTMPPDALANESRQFVTASKLFVKFAVEKAQNGRLIECLGVCVTLLNRMATLGSATGGPISECVRKVALAFLRTVEVAASSGGEKNQLMESATTLASALTALMRTLKTGC